MSLRQLRIWLATCDEPGGPVSHTNQEPVDRWEAGLDLNNTGWQAAPGSRQTLCPAHADPDRELDPDPVLAARQFGALFRDPPSKS